MRNERSFVGPGAVLALGLMLSGCSEARDDLPREAVSGTVTLDGKPLEKGAIHFSPAPGAETPVEVGGMVREGKFQIERSAGPVPGKYKVRITEEFDRPGGHEGDPFGERPKARQSRIPARYNAETKLTADVEKGQTKSFEFALESALGPEDQKPSRSAPRSRRHGAMPR